MLLEADGVAIDLEPRPGALHVLIDKKGFDPASLDVISQYADVRETDAGLELRYELTASEVPYRHAIGGARTRLERLQLAQALMACAQFSGDFRVPLIHPDNVYLNGTLLRVVHVGLRGVLAPTDFDEAGFLSALQAMVLQVFHPKLAFEQIRDGAAGLRDRFSSSVRQTASVEELFALVDAQVTAERAEVAATRVSVSKPRYAWFRVLGVVGVVAALVAGVFAWQSAAQSRMQTAVIAAQARFLASDYAGTMAALNDEAAADLPASAKYVLAVSSVNLHDLTPAQKQAILNTMSEKSDDVTLNYWIASGRGQFEQALDYAKNLGDDQLTLLAYTDLYQATKLDTKLPGSEKQDLLSEYEKAIGELTAKLDGTADSEKEG